MSFVGSLRLTYRLAAAAALLVVAEVGPNLMPGSVTGGNPPADRPLVALPPHIATPRLQNFDRTPLCFEANQGQTDAQVQYLARGSGYTVFLTATEAVLTANPVRKDADLPGADKTSWRPSPQPQAAAVRMQLLGSDPAVQARGIDRRPGIVNYFRGHDASKWHTHIPIYARVHYADVYPGIDLVYYGNPAQLEYDFVVRPGADPSQIRLRFAEAQSVRINAGGELVVQAGDQMLLQGKPVVYQNVAGERRQVAADFVVTGQEVSFALGSYDRSQPLVVDPVLSYSTYLGGSSMDAGISIAVDAAGNAYVTGNTTSPDFPTAKPLQPAIGSSSLSNVFVAKLATDGSGLVYSTYLGGSGDTVLGQGDNGTGIAVDAAGNAYVTGITGSADFPTVHALQPDYGGGNGDAFVAKLTPDGSALVYSTYLGGSDLERGNGIAVNTAGNAFVIGATRSRDFPIANALQPVNGGYNAFVAKLASDGSKLLYSTYLGGSIFDRAFGIAVDATGGAYVTGFTTSPDFPIANALQPVLNGSYNAFVAKLTADGSALVYSTYLGGSILDQGFSIAVDAAGSVHVTGATSSPDFPTVNPFQPTLSGDSNAFVAKLTADGSTLVYSTFLGGGNSDFGRCIAVDAVGNAYVTGTTNSPDFPTVNPFQPTLSGDSNAFVAELITDGSALVYSTYLGGNGSDHGTGLAVDAAGNAFVTGDTTSPDFPIANPLQPALRGVQNAFVAKISP